MHCGNGLMNIISAVFHTSIQMVTLAASWKPPWCENGSRCCFARIWYVCILMPGCMTQLSAGSCNARSSRSYSRRWQSYRNSSTEHQGCGWNTMTVRDFPYLFGIYEEQWAWWYTVWLYLVPLNHWNQFCTDPVALPQHCKIVNLRTSGLYELILFYLRHIWPDKQIITDGGTQEGLIFYSTASKSYATISVQNLRYGSSLHHGGKLYLYGFVDGRVAARIDHLFCILIDQQNGLAPLITRVALIQRFKATSQTHSSQSTCSRMEFWKMMPSLSLMDFWSSQRCFLYLEISDGYLMMNHPSKSHVWISTCCQSKNKID